MVEVDTTTTTTTNSNNNGNSIRPKSRGISDFTSALEFIGKTKSNKSATAKQATSNSTGSLDTTSVKSGNATSTAVIAADRVANPYVDVIYKRLRTLKKRLTRIEKYEDIVAQYSEEELPQYLNEDQRKSIAEKPGIEGAIRELEETHKQLLSVDAEETHSQKKKKQEQEKETRKMIHTAVNDANMQGDKAIETIAFKKHLFATMSKPLDNEDINNTVQHTKPASSMMSSIVRQLANASDETFTDDITFAQVQSVIDQGLQPIVDAPIEQQENGITRHEVVDTTIESNHHLNIDTTLQDTMDIEDNDNINEESNPPGGFCFIHTSEIFDVEPDTIDMNEPSQEVAVNALDDTQQAVDSSMSITSNNHQNQLNVDPLTTTSTSLDSSIDTLPKKRDIRHPRTSTNKGNATPRRGSSRGGSSRGGRGMRGSRGSRGGRGNYHHTRSTPQPNRDNESTTATTPAPAAPVTNNESNDRTVTRPVTSRGRGGFRGHPHHHHRHHHQPHQHHSRGSFRGGRRGNNSSSNTNTNTNPSRNHRVVASHDKQE
ncbi:hypothetical protein BDF22DRAFT_681519 [Syncephalis plumigaleata]|nr:hypothetical protein BDF22DRAFT_681519 [Syncephalis plumigaleata]